MKKIMIFYSNRAEKGLLQPVMRRIEKSDKFDLLAIDLFKDLVEPKSIGDYGLLYNSAYRLIKREKPALVICPFDRFEMIFPTLAAYYQNIPISQIHAGDLSVEGSWDDATRHVISLYATIHFCEGESSYNRVVKLLETVGRTTEYVYEVGSTSLDDVIIDEGLCPKQPYDLVVYNSPTSQLDKIHDEMHKIISMLNKFTVWIEPSGKDLGDNRIIASLYNYQKKIQALRVLKTLPRSQFLGLLKNCKRYISNSSSLFYEAPAFLSKSQIIHIGIRNKGREYIKIRKGGSDRIVSILEKYLNEQEAKRICRGGQ